MDCIRSVLVLSFDISTNFSLSEKNYKHVHILYGDTTHNISYEIRYIHKKYVTRYDAKVDE